MLLTVVLLRGKDFVEVESKYVLQLDIINCDDNGAYGDTRSAKKDYFVQEEDGKLIVNTVYKESNQFV